MKKFKFVFLSSPTFEAVKQDTEHQHVVNSFIAPQRAKDNLDEKKSGKSHFDTNFSSTYVHTALAKLKSVSFNWFAFVALLQPEFASAGYDTSFLDRYLNYFFEHIRSFNLPEGEIQLIENSRNAYLSSQVVNESEYVNCFASFSDSSNDEVEFESNDNLNEITKKLARIKDNARKKAKEEIAINRFMRKKVTPSTKSILKTHPNIGKVIEDFVEQCDIGADKWRRTGFYTFSGDVKDKKRVTFSKIREKLKEHFGREFSHGTVN